MPLDLLVVALPVTAGASVCTLIGLNHSCRPTPTCARSMVHERGPQGQNELTQVGYKLVSVKPIDSHRHAHLFTRITIGNASNKMPQNSAEATPSESFGPRPELHTK